MRCREPGDRAAVVWPLLGRVAELGSLGHKMVTRVLNQPSDRVLGAEFLKDATLLDFWKWAFGDLCDDDWKGISLLSGWFTSFLV